MGEYNKRERRENRGNRCLKVNPGRKGKYYTDVKPYLEQIKKWSQAGVLEQRIIDELEIGKSTFYRYKAEHSELREALKKGRVHALVELDAALFKRAKGYEYEESKTYIKRDEITGHKTSYTECSKKHMPPDVAAINLLKKNWDKDNWSNDPQLLEIKKQELELKKKIAEEKNW